MKTRESKAEDAGWLARSVLECADSLPLSTGLARPDRRERQPIGAVQTPAGIFAQIVLLFVAACPVVAQSYSIDWSTIDGGGGTGTGGVYMVSGTIGQPDAGTMSGGSFTLHGGFWGIIAALQTPGTPWLTVARTATNGVIISWPLPATGWMLQSTTNLVASGSLWTGMPPPYTTNGANLEFAEPSPTGNRFYRLYKP